MPSNPYARLQAPMQWAFWQQKNNLSGFIAEAKNPFEQKKNPWMYSRWNRQHGTATPPVRRRRRRRYGHCHCFC